MPWLPRLIAVSDRRSLADGDLGAWTRRLAAAGIEGLQLREKDLDDRALYELTREVRTAFPAPGRWLLVNGRLDLALAAGGDGVHLPAAGIPTAALRRGFGPEVVIGRSTHSPEEVEAAAEAGADYVTFGPVYPTPSKPGWETPPGAEGLRRACRAGLPVFALGGVGLEQLAEVAEAGAAGAAGIRVFQQHRERLAELAAEARRHFPREER